MEQLRSPRYLIAIIAFVVLIPLVLVLVLLAVRLSQGDGTGTTSTQTSQSTTFVCDSAASLNISVGLQGHTDNGDGTFTVDYRITLRNNSNATAVNVSANSILSQSCNPNFSATVVSISSSSLNLNGGYNGTSNTALLLPGASLPANSTHTINLRVRVPFTPGTCSVLHQVNTSGSISGQCASSTPTSQGTISSRSSASSASATGTGTPTASASASQVPSASASVSSSASATTSIPTQDEDAIIFDVNPSSSSTSSTYSLPWGAK